jgi:hypothetical protein
MINFTHVALLKDPVRGSEDGATRGSPAVQGSRPTIVGP